MTRSSAANSPQDERTMNSYERFKTAVALQEPDLVPVAPYMGNYGAAVAGVPIDKYCRSAELMAKAQVTAVEIFDQDALVMQSDNYYIAEGLGTQVRHHENSTPTFAAPAIAELSDVFDLQVPDPIRDGRMPVYLEAIERVAHQYKGVKVIRACGTGAFSLASHLLGTEEFLLALAICGADAESESRRCLSRLMEIATESLIAFAVACIDAGADIVQSGDSLASPDMISPAMYRDWAYPYEEQFFNEVNPHARAHDAVTLLHICGNTTPILTDMADTGAMILELDSKVSVGHAKHAIGHRVCLLGNLDPTTVLLHGSQACVEEQSRAVIESAAAGGGLILG
jgi:uroporphyrinogen decarboxylase